MSTTSSIEWTDATWNPVRGCSKVSEGCRNCYAMKQAHRFSGPGKPYEGLTHLVVGKGPQWTGAIRLVPEVLTDPLRWRAPRRVFVNSMSDLFHEDVPFEFVTKVFAVMALCPQHTFQILTKRPERMAAYFELYFLRTPCIQRSSCADLLDLDSYVYGGTVPWPLPNVWLGVSVEDQAAADERIPHLLRTPAAVRFLSCEPLLGPVDLGPALPHIQPCDDCFPGRRSIDWVIAGGESGPGARPCNVRWLRDLVAQCREASVAVFVKQVGSRPLYADGTLHVDDRKGGDPSEWPEDLRVREFPGSQQ